MLQIAYQSHIETNSETEMSEENTNRLLQAVRYYSNIKPFISDTLCSGDLADGDFIPGTQRIEFFGELIDSSHRINPKEHDLGGTTYEEALLSRIINKTDLSTLLLIGGLGAGKTTAIKHVLNLLRAQRQRLKITKCPENCSNCTRDPLYVNCMGIGQKEMSVQDALSQVTQKIRDAVYEQLITEWFARFGFSKRILEKEGPVMQVFRRLIITNDLRTWAHHQQFTNLDLPASPELDAKTPILSLRPTEDTLNDLMDRFEKHIVRLDGWLGRMHHNQRDNIDFTSILLRFYLSKCPASNPQNFLVVDNLDELPTRHIEEIAHHVHQLSEVNTSFLVVIPVRPSSILTKGHIRQTDVWYHYGPDCAKMMLHRLEKYVLSRSAEELKSTNLPTALKSPFSVTPQGSELQFFLVAVYLFARILAGRLGLEINISRDHRWLLAIRVPENTANNIASTLGALIGTCARYANEQLIRYFRSIYHNPIAVFETISRLNSEGKTTIRMPYKLIVDSIIFDSQSSDSPISEHIANLYSPPSRGANDRLPSMTKIRALKYLRRWKRVTVKEIVSHLSLYGVPAEISIQALNALHLKDRLLVWFSENHELRSETQDGDQYVVISEHGMSYLEHVLGDFEYMWACSANMQGQGYRDVNFSVRLREYESLVRALGHTEWKQIAFRRCLANFVRPVLGAAEYGELTTLSVLYKSISRAVSGSGSILRRSEGADRDDSSNQVIILVRRLCELVDFWQGRYEICFNGSGYRNVYSSWRIEALAALRSISKYFDREKPEDAPIFTSIDELSITSWEPPANNDNIGISLDQDYITKASRYLRSFLPFPKAWLDNIDNNLALKIHLRRFTEGEVNLGGLLAKTLPSFGEVELALSEVVRNIHYLIAHIEELGVATGEQLYEKVLKEQDFINKMLSGLRANTISDSPPCSPAAMSDRKIRFNNIMKIYVELAERFSHTSALDHLKIQWH